MGTEVRQGAVELTAESRIDRAGGAIEALGWGESFQQVSARLNLPPGWDVFHITGVDNVPDTWLQRWTLYDLFMVLVASVASRLGRFVGTLGPDKMRAVCRALAIAVGCSD